MCVEKIYRISYYNTAYNGDKMEQYLDEEKVKGKLVLALGDFDGVHRGHRRLLAETCAVAKKMEAIPGVYTFRENSKRLLGDQRLGLLTTEEEKNALLKQAGIECIYADDFEKIRELSPQAFVDYLVERFFPKAVVCGDNFTFGKGACADCAALAGLLSPYGCSVHIVPGLTLQGECISSTGVRRAIQTGDMKKAALLLGYPYFIRTRVVHGAHLGTRLGFPTVNQLEYDGKVIPKFGVYACLCDVDGETYMGVVNVGIRPTVSEGVNKPPVVFETHILDFSGDVYGKNVTVAFHKMLREEKKFASLDELCENVFINIEQTRNYFEHGEEGL